MELSCVVPTKFTLFLYQIPKFLLLSKGIVFEASGCSKVHVWSSLDHLGFHSVTIESPNTYFGWSLALRHHHDSTRVPRDDETSGVLCVKGNRKVRNIGRSSEWSGPAQRRAAIRTQHTTQHMCLCVLLVLFLCFFLFLRFFLLVVFLLFLLFLVFCCFFFSFFFFSVSLSFCFLSFSFFEKESFTNLVHERDVGSH